VTEIAYRLNGNCYLNITDRCSLRCGFCPKFSNQWQVRGHDLRLRREPTLAEITAALPVGDDCREVVFCGLGEPTRRLYTMLSVADRLQRRGLRVRLNTDGLANRRAAQDITADLAGRVDALSVSLNAQDARTYERHCRPPFEHAWSSVIDFVRAARRHIGDITVTAIDGLPGVDIAECARIAEGLGVSFRRRVLDQVG